MSGSSAFIAGEWVPVAGETAELTDPSRGTPFATVTMADPASIDRAVASARGAFDDGGWSALSPQARTGPLLAMADFLEANAPTYGDRLVEEIGLPIPFAHGNLIGAAHLLRYYASLAADYPWIEARVGVSGVRTQLARLPAGVVAAIVPWNAPISLASSKIAPALLAGCTTVVKASPLNALSIRCLGEAAAAAGLPPGVLNITVAGPDASERLVHHPSVDAIAFTGSDATGRRIAEVAAATLKRVTLELGGKSAGIVLDDAPLDRLVATVPPAFTLNNGEACAALTRLVVPRTREKEIAAALAEVVSAIPVGDPRDATTLIGPLATKQQYERVLSMLAAAREEGEVVCGGGRPADQPAGYYLEPTIVRGVSPSSPIAQTELFAPVLTILGYDDVEEAVQIANDSRYGLSGAVFAADDDRALEIARRIRSGSVHLNNGFTVDIAIPFGGFKSSGYGREFGPEAIDGYVETQAVFLDGRPYGS